jgi:hypothetical protein
MLSLSAFMPVALVQVAVKLVPMAGTADVRKQLENEIMILGRVSSACAHACRLYGVCHVGNELGIVMKRYPKSLRGFIEEQPGGKVRALRPALARPERYWTQG